nr:hypothetical protein [Tautonia plasticadhaerens]
MGAGDHPLVVEQPGAEVEEPDPGQPAERGNEAVDLLHLRVGAVPPRRRVIRRRDAPGGQAHQQDDRPGEPATDLGDHGGDALGDLPGLVDRDVVRADHQDDHRRVDPGQLAVPDPPE